MRKRKHTKRIVFAIIIPILLFALLYSGLRIVETTVLRTAQDVEVSASKTITRNGVEYFPRQDITTVLVLGIDRSLGEVDRAEVLILDETNEVCNILRLNCDTMLEMPVLDPDGKKTGTEFGRLALAHTYGSGREDSCENTRQAISDLLGGISIDYYMAMSVDTIAALKETADISGISSVVKMYQEMSKDIVTDCSRTTIISMAGRFGSYAMGEEVSPEGESVTGGEYSEYYVDEEKLDALVLRLFYTAKG